MKIILCLVLIAFGLYGIYKEYKRRIKVKRAIMMEVVANHIIAKHALAELLVTGEMKKEDYFDSMKKLTDNSIDIILKACGTDYVQESDWLMNEYGKEGEK